jgi:hypothetical protein
LRTRNQWPVVIYFVHRRLCPGGLGGSGRSVSKIIIMANVELLPQGWRTLSSLGPLTTAALNVSLISISNNRAIKCICKLDICC